MGNDSGNCLRSSNSNELSESSLNEIYQDLRQLAAARLAQEAPGATLQATALVHEAWLRLRNRSKPWANKGHFFTAAAEAMRRILIDRARAKARARRGGKPQRVDLDLVTVASEDPDETVLTIHEALDTLEKRDPIKAEIVKLRYFVGLNQSEIAQVLGLSEATIGRHWRFARSWLHASLSQKSDKNRN